MYHIEDLKEETKVILFYNFSTLVGDVKIPVIGDYSIFKGERKYFINSLYLDIVEEYDLYDKGPVGWLPIPN